MVDNKPSPAQLSKSETLLNTLRQLQANAATKILDLEKVQTATEALFTHYMESAEAAHFSNPLEGPDLLSRFAGLYTGTTIATLSCRDLEQTLFEVIPDKVSASSVIARNVVETARAFYVWLKREHALEQADSLIELLGDDATRELEQHMEDPANSGPAKAMMMQAVKAGIDTTDEKAIEAFFRSRFPSENAFGLDSSYGDPFTDHGSRTHTYQTPEQRHASQKKRKKNRKARKRNR